MWRSSGILYLPYIFRTLKRVYKPTVVISAKLLKMSSFCQNMACGYRERAEVDPSDIYVWRMLCLNTEFDRSTILPWKYLFFVYCKLFMDLRCLLAGPKSESQTRCQNNRYPNVWCQLNTSGECMLATRHPCLSIM